MIPSISRFDRITASGILARMALALEDDANPAARTRLPFEEQLRVQIDREARNAIGVLASDNSITTKERIADFLDTESDQASDDKRFSDALIDLGNRGELPSDLYDVHVIFNIVHFHRYRYLKEEEFIKKTVSTPDQEQHYGKPGSVNEPFLISLFAKEFQSQSPGRSFTMLVAGQRNGLVLDVHQAWRIYRDQVDLTNVKSLVEMLEQFANKFGYDIVANGKTGRFFKFEDAGLGMEGVTTTTSFELAENQKGKHKLGSMVTCFTQRVPNSDRLRAALVSAIDLDKYRHLLKTKGW